MGSERFFTLPRVAFTKDSLLENTKNYSNFKDSRFNHSFRNLQDCTISFRQSENLKSNQIQVHSQLKLPQFPQRFKPKIQQQPLQIQQPLQLQQLNLPIYQQHQQHTYQQKQQLPQQKPKPKVRFMPTPPLRTKLVPCNKKHIYH